MRRAVLGVVLVVAAGCGTGGEGRAAGTGAGTEAGTGAGTARPGASALAPWARDKKAPGATSDGDGSPVAPTDVDPTALDELIAAAPKEKVQPTGENGGTAIGTETGEKPAAEPKKKPDDAPPPAKEAAMKASQISFGPLSIQAEMSSASIEREARAQLYWGLVQRCRAKDGSYLPPDVVTLVFRIDNDGYIVGSSINATPSKPIYDDAASCMRRELSAATFRAPVGARGMLTLVTMTVPSVD